MTMFTLKRGPQNEVIYSKNFDAFSINTVVFRNDATRRFCWSLYFYSASSAPPFHFFHQSSKCCLVPSGSTRQELRKKKEKTKMWGGRFRREIESNGIDIPFFFNLIETTERSTSAMADDDDRA